MNNTTGGVYTDAQMRRWNAIARYGWPVVISSNSWAITVALIALLYQAVAVRLFRPYTMALFWLLSEDHREWDVDQFRVAMANTKSPLAALCSKPAYRSLLGLQSCRKERRSAKGISLLWLLGAIVLAVFPFLLPLILAKGIAVVEGVPGSTEYCSPILNASNWMASAHYDKLLSLEMLQSVDAHGYYYGSPDAASIGLPHDKDRVVISSDCPDWAPVCERKNPLRIDIDFWVKQSQLGIASRAPSRNAEFGVLNTCYKLQLRVKLVREWQDGADTYGLLYGTGSNTNGTPYVTEQFTPAEKFGYGYNLFSHFTGMSGDSHWKPNKTLDHDGDLTILFYHIGNILSPSPSDDPLFGTSSTLANGTDIYSYAQAIVPIICNTSYAYCPGGGEECVSLSNNDAVGQYVYKHENSSNSASLGFLELMWINTWVPLFHMFPGSSESVYASRTLSLGSSQLAPRAISGHAELVRLALASRMLLLTSANRAVSGWRKYVSPGLPVRKVPLQDEQLDTCRLTLMPRPGKITTSGWEILIIILVGGVLLLLSFTGPVLRFLFWKQLCIFTIRWRLRTAPHLHRTTLERGDPSRFWPGGAADEWPVGKGRVDRVGLVESATGYHAVYRYDAELRSVQKGRRLKREGRRADEIVSMENLL
ncbi:hypothetical protein B0T10DRAFT_561912 [Thelonectria olida]|uniref:Uncharacterized protein n=1 Tax=Thelonectria olida TaxID=1576542 RepID=A0A9P8W3Q1_9HYPO|nr:hypothetical protein B0T10DRAFT_561912 [Thelonectria olida]